MTINDMTWHKTVSGYKPPNPPNAKNSIGYKNLKVKARMYSWKTADTINTTKVGPKRFPGIKISLKSL